METHTFVGREAEARAVLANLTAGRSTLLTGEAGVGKSALLEYLAPLMAEEGILIATSRVTPFGTFIKDLFQGLWDHGRIPSQSKDLAADWKLFGKQNANNDEKAKRLIALIADTPHALILIDDAGGITASSRPWLEQLCEAGTVLAAVDPIALKRPGTKRFWKRFDEIKLGRLSKSDAAELLTLLVQRYRVSADEPEVYKRRVLDLAQGSPFELERLVKYHASETLVRTRDLGSYSEQFVERDVKQVALAPLLMIAGMLVVAGRYIARAQDNQDLYVVSGILMAVTILLTPWLRASLKPRSRS